MAPPAGTNFYGTLNPNVNISLTNELGYAVISDCIGNPNSVAIQAGVFNTGCQMIRMDILTGNNLYYNLGTLANPNWLSAGNVGGVSSLNALVGAVTISAGTGITLTPSGNNIAISAISVSPLNTKGDLYTYTTTNARLGVGTDGFLLSADSTQPTGLKWIVAPTGTSIGGTITGGTAGSVLFVNPNNVIAQDNVSLHYDIATKQLMIGTATPQLNTTFSVVNTTGSIPVVVWGDTTNKYIPAVQLMPNIGLDPFSVALNASAFFGMAMTPGDFASYSQFGDIFLGSYDQNNIKNMYFVTGSAATLNLAMTPGGQNGMGVQVPTATLHLQAGTATASTSPLKFTAGTNLTTTEAGAIEYNGSHLYFTATNSGPRFQLDQQGVSNYAHTIFTPTTGGTVALVNNQYNIINPSGALLALTVNLPSSPANNDVVYIKFTQTISTVTYGNGTVVDGITAPTAGGLTVLVFDSGTSKWY